MAGSEEFSEIGPALALHLASKLGVTVELIMVTGRYPDGRPVALHWRPDPLPTELFAALTTEQQRRCEPMMDPGGGNETRQRIPRVREDMRQEVFAVLREVGRRMTYDELAGAVSQRHPGERGWSADRIRTLLSFMREENDLMVVRKRQDAGDFGTGIGLPEWSKD